MRTDIKNIFILMFVFVLVLCVSCGTQEEVFDEDYSIKNEADLTGQHYRWGSEWDQEIMPTEFFSFTGDMEHKRLRDLEAEYGCTLTVEHWQDGGSNVLAEVAAGLETIDFLDSHARAGGIELYRLNLLYALEDIPGLDFTDNKYGSTRFLQYGIFDGLHYGFYHFAWEFPPEYHGVLHFNTEMLATLGMYLPHDMQENGMWDWTHFKQYLIDIAEAAKNAGYDQSFVPFICGSNYGDDALGFMFSNGLKMIEGTDGNYSFGFDNANGLAAIEFLHDLYNEGLYMQKGPEVFVKNKMGAMMSHETYYSTHYYEKSTSSNYLPAQGYEYGLIRFPHGPNGDEKSVSGYVHHGRRLNWVLNCNSKSVEDIGTVMEFVFRPLDNSEGWSVSLRDQIFYTDEDHEDYCDMIENINFSYGNIYLDNVFDTWKSGLISAVTGHRTASEVFEASRSAIQEAIKENVTWTIDELEPLGKQ